MLWKNKTDSAYTTVQLDASTTSYELTGLANGATYYWKVQSLGDNAAFVGSAYTTARTVRMTEPVQLAAPTNPVETGKTETTISVAWDAVANASGYRLLWKIKTDSSYARITLDAASTSYDLTGLANDAIYCWKVQALGDGDAYLNSAYTATRTVKATSESSVALDLGAELFDELDEEDYDLLAHAVAGTLFASNAD